MSTKNTLESIKSLISQGQIGEALNVLNHIDNDSLWYQNARAVCFMRSGEPKKAAQILSSLVYKRNSIILDSEVPTVIKINCVTAMLLEGNVAGALNILNSMDESAPIIKKVQEAIKKWRKCQSIWFRIAMFLGMYPYNRPVPLDFPPGELEAA